MTRAVALVGAVALASVGAGARPDCALACTCVPLRVGPALEEADAAFVGTLLERRVVGDAAQLAFAVERRLKGPLGDRVTVVTPDDSAGCGIDATDGTRLALFVERDGERWTGSLCRQAAPELVASVPTAASGEEVADSFAEATAYVLAILVLGAVGVFLLRRRFRPD